VGDLTIVLMGDSTSEVFIETDEGEAFMVREPERLAEALRYAAVEKKLRDERVAPHAHGPHRCASPSCEGRTHRCLCGFSWDAPLDTMAQGWAEALQRGCLTRENNHDR
jgi:hypothetical protein